VRSELMVKREPRRPGPGLLPTMTLRALPLLVPFLLASLDAQTFVRVRDGVIEKRGGAVPTAPSLTSITAAPCGTLLGTHDGLPIVNEPGATVMTNAFMNPACTNRHGDLAFFGNASGARNQGIFVASGGVVRAIAMGCGQGGGSGQHGSCGDPSPVGGTFGGFFGGTTFAPPINDQGDVLFVADIANGSTLRGLFLFQGGTQSIVKVAGVGDPSPLGGVFTAMGPGALDRDGNVVFLAASTGSAAYTADLFQWQSGLVTTFCAAGQPAPGGATVAMLGTESFGFVDGTTVFAGPVPSISACGQVAFRILTTGGSVGRGIAVRTNGTDAWYLTDAMATPNGGSFFDFQAAAINGNGQIAVFADYMQGGTPTSGWFVGKPGSWRNALSFYDQVDGGQCMGLAFSRSPMTPLSDDGDLVVWCDLASAGNMGRILVCASDGSQSVMARQTGSTGAGGYFGWIDAWPSMTSAGRVVIGTGTPGSLWTSAHIVKVLCGPGIASSPCTSPGDAIELQNFGTAGSSFLACASFTTQNVTIPGFGALLIGPGPIAVLTGIVPYPGINGPHTLSLPLPNNAAFRGLALNFQSLAITATGGELTNRATTILD
jgi:hypothetical protein